MSDDTDITKMIEAAVGRSPSFMVGRIAIHAGVSPSHGVFGVVGGVLSHIDDAVRQAVESGQR
jgi:hypothetical protein